MHRPLRARLAARAALAGVAAMAALGPAAAPAWASCVVFGTEEEMLAAAEAVFVGRVATTTNADRWAMVEIREIWWGPDVPATVEVRGGEAAGVGSSVDRQYAVGTVYLFAVDVRDGVLHDNACSMTTPWDDALIRLRPADARPPRDAPAPAGDADAGVDAGISAGVGPVVAVVLSVAMVGLLVFGAVFGLSRRR